MSRLNGILSRHYQTYQEQVYPSFVAVFWLPSQLGAHWWPTVVTCPYTGKVTSVKFGADAKYIAVGSMDRNLRIFGLPGDDQMMEESNTAAEWGKPLYLIYFFLRCSCSRLMIGLRAHGYITTARGKEGSTGLGFGRCKQACDIIVL